MKTVQAALIEHATAVYALASGQKILPKLVENVVNDAVIRLFNRGTVDIEAAKGAFEELIAAAQQLAASRTPPLVTAEDVRNARYRLPPKSLYV